MPKPNVIPIKTAWSNVALVCGKCRKKLKGGFGPKGKERLSKALIRDLGAGKGRRAGLCIVETRRMDICPKCGVTIANGHQPEQLLVIAEGTPVDQIAAAPGLPALAQRA
ncbi:(2Fe-2S) ferredoxin domain-containing protein [Oleomonas cavernae]|uniref:(2Fe-2S) ferredoxin domain-containing protein n=1 Tax=Oleomonas cavernae TaxID=2320859 RepID=A0A418WCB7_9PROT|nr:(2Fe-2S) ferredoxin domain-containing protein [Oleomonas cavernae]RJF87606.1 (2Fe-2S) ferredoxin domain-containing protein [Oleomonas cavernae]